MVEGGGGAVETALERAAKRAERVALLNAAGADDDDDGKDATQRTLNWTNGKGIACTFIKTRCVFHVG